MGSRSIWGLAMAAMVVTAILCSNSCGASTLRKANNATAATAYGEVSVELMISSEISRFLNFGGVGSHSDSTSDANQEACANGAGNPSGVCNGSAANTQKCDAYEGAAACT